MLTSWLPCTVQAGLPNLLDKGVQRVGRERGVDAGVEAAWTFLDEIPFDFERRRLSVVPAPPTQHPPSSARCDLGSAKRHCFWLQLVKFQLICCKAHHPYLHP